MSGKNSNSMPFPRSIAEIDPPQIQHTTISPGIPVTFITNTTLPMVVLEIIFYHGARSENIEQKGITVLTLNLADEGAGPYDSLTFHDKFDFLGSNIHCYGDQDTVRIQITSLRETFAETMGLVSLMLHQPRFDVKDFDREKHRMLVQLQQAKDVADRIADRVLTKKIFSAGHLYGKDAFGTIKTLETVTRENSLEWFRKILTTSSIEVVAAGAIDGAYLHDILSSSLSSLFPVNPAREELSIEREYFPASINIVHRDGAPQTEIMMGHQAPKVFDGDHLARSAANMILGGQFSSRLNLNLREKHGFTYGAHSYFSSRQLCGEYILATSVGAKDTAKALEQIFIELEKIKKGVTKKEVAFVKSSMVNRFSLGFETNTQLLFNMIFLRLHEAPETYFSTYVEHLKKLDSETILNAAKENIDPQAMQVVLVGNRDEIKAGLAASSITIPTEEIENDSLW